MRKFLTLKVSTSFWVLLGFLGLGNVVNAQSFYIEFLSPAEIRGQRVAFVAGATTKVCNLPFGDSLTTQLTDPILAGDPNDPNNTQYTFAQPLNGNVGVCRRGSFAFDVKAANIEFNGGSGSIIINNDQANKDAIISMSQTEGAFSIWSVAVSLNTGDNFFAKYPGCSFKFVQDFPVDTDVVIWSDNGFDGGLDGWTTVGISCGDANQDPTLAEWQWDADGKSKGAFGSTGIVSATVCNGAMVYNSDFLDNNGDQNNLGGGPCIANQQGELISPTIDLSAYPEETAITMKFSQAVRQFQSEYFVGWSEDDGATWTEIPINSQLVINANPTNASYRVRLVGAKPSATFKVKFRINANYYYWIVDDVKLVEPENYNGKVDKDWVAGAPYPSVPLGQSVPVQFMTDVHNIGGKSLTGMQLKATVKNANGDEVYSATTAPTSPGQEEGTVMSGDTIQNVIFGSYTPDQVGDYSIEYTLTSNEEDFDSTDNRATASFTVTDENTGDFSRENAITRSISLAFSDTDPVNWVYANVLRAERDGDIAKNVKFGVVNAQDLSAAGASAYCYVWECEDSDGDYQITETERTLVGFNYHDFTENDPDELNLDLPILNFETEEPSPVTLHKGKWYIVGLAYEATQVNPRLLAYWQASDLANQSAIEFIGLANEDYVPTHFLMQSWDLSSTFNLAPIPTGGRSVFTGTPVPSARRTLDNLGSTKNLKLDGNAYSVYPTNATTEVTVKFNFDNATDVLTEVYDVKGNKVYSKNLKNQKDQTNMISTNQLAAGTYFVRVTTAEGALSKPFNVIK